jgi:hypothetical protein
MKKFISMMFIFWVALVVSGCASQPVNSPNSPSDQRDRADKAQGELSNEVRK